MEVRPSIVKTLLCPCKFKSKGCSYIDIDLKAEKHEMFYCKYDTGCVICSEHVAIPREQHYESAHVTYKAGAICRIPVLNVWELFIIASEIGQLFCQYILEDLEFILNIWSPLHSEQLSDYRCVVKLTNPVTGHTVRRILPLNYNAQSDWQLNMNEDEFLMYVSDNEFDIKIELTKK